MPLALPCLPKLFAVEKLHGDMSPGRDERKAQFVVEGRRPRRLTGNDATRNLEEDHGKCAVMARM